MAEDQARAALRAFAAVGEVEHWIAAQPWQATPGGWTMPGDSQGLRFRVEPAPDGARVVASAGKGRPVESVVPG